MNIKRMKFFTIIEMLVVIAIIGILATMLIPSLKKARLSGLTAVSVSNLKQLHMASMLYTKENNSFFCLASENPHPVNGNPEHNFRRLIYECIQGKPFASNWSTAQQEMAASSYKDMMFCPVLRNERGPKTFHSQGRGDYSINRHFSDYRNIAQITEGKKEPFILPVTQMGNGGSYAAFFNTEYGQNVSAEYKYTNQRSPVLYLEGNVSFMTMSQGAAIDSLVNTKNNFE